MQFLELISRYLSFGTIFFRWLIIFDTGHIYNKLHYQFLCREWACYHLGYNFFSIIYTPILLLYMLSDWFSYINHVILAFPFWFQ